MFFINLLLITILLLLVLGTTTGASIGEALMMVAIIYAFAGIFYLFVIVPSNLSSYKTSYKPKSYTYNKSSFSSKKNVTPKSIKNAQETYYTNRGYKNPLRDSSNSWDDFYELKNTAKKELNKGNITRKQYDKIMHDAEDEM